MAGPVMPEHRPAHAAANDLANSSEQVRTIRTTAIDDDWIRKDVAAQMIGLTERMLEKRAKKGDLQTIRRKSGAHGRLRTHYHREGLHRLLSEQQRVQVLPSPVGGPQALSSFVSVPVEFFERVMFHVTRTGSPNGSPASVNGSPNSAPPGNLEATYLAYALATWRSGLTRQQLRELAAEGKIATIGRGRTLRFRRADLEAL